MYLVFSIKKLSAGRNNIFADCILLLKNRDRLQLQSKKIFIPTSALIINFLFVGLLLAFPSNASAQTVSLGVYPPIFTIKTTPPADINSPFLIKNFTDNTVEMTISLKPFKSGPDNNGELIFLDPGQPVPGNDPLIFQKMHVFDQNRSITTITLAPQEAKQLELRMSLPQDEPASDYYFTILFTTNAIGNDQSNVSAIAGGIGINVLLSIGPDTPTTGFIKEFSSPIFVQKGPVPFTVEVQNNSTHFINPKGTILIQNIFGQFVGRLGILPVNILEHTSRFIPDDKNLNSTQEIWPEKFLLGLYKAKLTVALSDTGPLFTKTIYFFALPAEAIIAVMLLIILSTIIIVRVRERLKKM